MIIAIGRFYVRIGNFFKSVVVEKYGRKDVERRVDIVVACVGTDQRGLDQRNIGVADGARESRAGILKGDYVADLRRLDQTVVSGKIRVVERDNVGRIELRYHGVVFTVEKIGRAVVIFYDILARIQKGDDGAGLDGNEKFVTCALISQHATIVAGGSDCLDFRFFVLFDQIINDGSRRLGRNGRAVNGEEHVFEEIESASAICGDVMFVYVKDGIGAESIFHGDESVIGRRDKIARRDGNADGEVLRWFVHDG